MNAQSNHSTLLQAMLDGTLDAAGEQAALDLLASDAEARAEFARLAQMHAWLSADEGTRAVLTAPALVRRKVIPHPVWWLAAAVAAAVIFFTASRLWPMPGEATPLAYKGPPKPMIQTACFECHRNLEAFLPAMKPDPLN
jgi:hypothetical protein